MPITFNWGPNCLSSHDWRWTLALWPLSWPVTSSLFDLKNWGQTWLVMWSGSSLARYCFFSKLLLGYSFAVFAAKLASHQVNTFCFFVPDSNNVHAPGLIGVITLYTLPRGWHCICEFCLGDEAKRGTHWHVLCHKHSSRLPCLSSLGLETLFYHLAEHWVNIKTRNCYLQ